MMTIDVVTSQPRAPEAKSATSSVADSMTTATKGTHPSWKGAEPTKKNVTKSSAKSSP